MTKTELIKALSRDTGLPIGKAEEVVKTVFNSMATALADGDRVEIRGLCAFFLKPFICPDSEPKYAAQRTFRPPANRSEQAT